MNIINNTEKILKFKYGTENVKLKPGEVFPFDGFKTENLKEIAQLVNLGLVTFYDDEDEDEIIPYNLKQNIKKAKETIREENVGVFKNLKFSKANFQDQDE
jgi:hypothetical protein